MDEIQCGVNLLGYSFHKAHRLGNYMYSQHKNDNRIGLDPNRRLDNTAGIRYLRAVQKMPLNFDGL